MRTDLLDYELPEELIASHPTQERDGARLLVLPRDEGDVEHRMVRELDALLPSDALLVVNDTRVIPARLLGHKRGSGGKAEILLVQRADAHEGHEQGRAQIWTAMGKASKGLKPGMEIALDAEDSLTVRVLERHEGSALISVQLVPAPSISVDEALDRLGHVPLPPYLKRGDELSDRERYQTVFARAPGAVAAPTAGLHLSDALLSRIKAKGIRIAPITLHVGLGTFQPVSAEDLDQHEMHKEWFSISPETANAIADARASGAPVIAVGTTVVRTLESAADAGRPGYVRAMHDETRLLIQPGFQFRITDALLTNFHLPRSTLLALIFAFAGRERILSAYREAIAHRYRFFSYGDAMLIRPSSWRFCV